MGGVSADAETSVSFREKLKDVEYRRKFTHSMLLFLSYIFLGVRNAQHSPAFLDLAQITGTNVEQASLFYTAISVGALIGAFSVGVLFDKLPNHRLSLLAGTCILGAVTTAAIPWSTYYPLTIAIFFINAFFHGGFDTGSNASIMSTWGVDGKMFMQILHFSFSVGTIISPFTVQPFLSRVLTGNSTNCHRIHSLQTTSPDTNTQLHDRQLTVPSVTLTESVNITVKSNDCLLSESRIHYAYLIAGILCLISGILLAAEGCISHARTKKSTEPNDNHRNPRVLPTWLNILILALISVVFFFHIASGMTIIGYIMAFSVEGLGWSKDRGTRLTAVFWAGFAASRLLGVFAIRCLSPSKMMVISNSIVLLSIGGLWLSVVQESDWGIWTCILFSAVGFAVIFPTGIIYIEHDVMKVTGKVTSVIWIAGNIQGVAGPPLLGYLMQEVSFMWYIYLALIEGALCFLGFGLLVLVVKLLVSKSDTLRITLHVKEEEEQANFIPKIVQFTDGLGETTC